MAAGGRRVGWIWEWRVGREVKGPKGVTLPGAWISEALIFFFQRLQKQIFAYYFNFFAIAI